MQNSVCRLRMLPLLLSSRTAQPCYQTYFHDAGLSLTVGLLFPFFVENGVVDGVMATNLTLVLRQVDVCDLTDFDANVDFYGFGVRLGVYLQWVSSWISNTMDPDNVSDNHEENSIFVLAIGIALAIAFVGYDDLRVSEAYILLLICTGYFCIVLSTWGIRQHLLRPGPVQVSPLFWHGNRLGGTSQSPKLSRLPGGEALHNMLTHYTTPRHMPLSQGGGVKPSGLSWAGAVWRSIIALFVVCLNLYLWLSYDPDIEERPDCRPTIYFFGSQVLTSGLRNFFIAMCFIAGLVILQLLLAMISVLYYLFARYVLGPLFDLLRIGKANDALLHLIAKRLRLANHQGLIPLDEVTALHIRSALFALCSQKPAALHQAHVHPHIHHEAGFKLSMTLVFCWHLFLCGMMVTFIVFIEMTIQINNIQGAFAIRSTSQLIPFVIGVISMLNTCRQLMLQWYEEDHPNEENTHFVLTGSLSQMTFSGMVFDSMKRFAPKRQGERTGQGHGDAGELGDLGTTRDGKTDEIEQHRSEQQQPRV